MKDWRKRCTKHGQPLLPCTAAQAAQWIRGRVRLVLGFSHVLLRQNGELQLRERGRLVRGWSHPAK